MDTFDLREILSSIPAIVALVIILVGRAKVWLAATPLNRVPIWVIASLVSGGLTWASYLMGHVQGDLFELVQRAVVLAAAGSGFREWWANGPAKPLSASSTARETLSRGKTPLSS